MRRLVPVLALSVAAGCSKGDSESMETRTGLRLTVEYESSLDVRTIALFGTWEDGEVLPESTHPVPLSVDPPGLRQVELVVDLSRTGTLNLRADGRSEAGDVLGSGRQETTVTAGEMTPVRIVLGTPVTCGDGQAAPGVEDCDDGNTKAGDGCSPTCTAEPGWTCDGRTCTKCGNDRLEEGETCDDGNTISGDGCSERCTVESMVPLAHEVEQLETQTTTSAEWVSIPGTTLSFAPNFASETWMIFASGRLRSTDPEEITAELRLMIDGEEADLVGHQTTGVTDNWGGFVVFDRIEQSTETHTVALEFRAELGTTEADDLRIVAVALPAGADFRYTEQNGSEERTGVAMPFGSLDVTPSAPGDYVVLAKISHSELPSSSTVRSWLEDSGGAPHPNDPNGSGYSNGRGPWAPMFVAFKTRIEGPRSFTLRGTSSALGDTSNWWDDAWDHRRPITIASTGTVTPDGYGIAITFDHADMVAAGRSRPDGSDVRIVHRGAELDRVLAPESSWNQTDTTIWFATSDPIAADGADTYHLYYGNPDAADPPADPDAVHLFFDDFDDLMTSETNWSIELGNNVSVAGGALTVGPNTALAQLGSYAENTIWEIRSRLSAPLGYRMIWLQAVSPQGQGSISWFSDGGDHHAETNGYLTHFTGDTPTAFHVWRFARQSDQAVHFWQDENPIVVHDPATGTIPQGSMVPAIANETDGEEITVDWVRIRRWVSPEPGVELGGRESLQGGGASRWAYPKLMAFRADAWDGFDYAETLAPETTTATTFQPVTELVTTAPAGPSDYLVIQSERISGDSNADARRSGELRADGVPLMVTAHKISRNSAPGNGYHHVAGVADLRQTAASVRYENGFSSPDGISVRAAESVILVLRHPPAR